MPLPNTSDIDNALVAKLASDSQLLALCPNNVHWDVANKGDTRFVVVSLVVGLDEYVFDGRAWEDKRYLVTARMRSGSGGNVDAAAARIDALLQDVPLVVAGYVWSTTYRESPERFTEVDEVDRSIRWFVRGGTYRVQMAIVPDVVRRGLPMGVQGTEQNRESSYDLDR